MSNKTNNCIYCGLSLEKEYFNSLHDVCRTKYLLDMDNQESLLGQWRLDSRISISIDTNYPTIDLDSLKTKANLFSPFYDFESNPIHFKIQLGIDKESNYVKTLEIKCTNQDSSLAQFIIDKIPIFRKVEFIQLVNFQDIGIINSYFSSLTALKKLFFYNTFFGTRSGSFTLPLSLHTIILDVIDSSTFVNLIINALPSTIHTIFFQFVNLSSITESLTALKGLHDLFLIHTHLSELPDSLTNLSNLHTLELDNNALKFKPITLPESFSSLKQLERLTLTHNEIIDCHQIHDLPLLKSLDLSYNFITDLSSLNNLPALEELNVNSNDCPVMPVLQHFSSLKKLLISGIVSEEDMNQKITLPDNLEELEIDYVTQIESISHLQSLRKLIIKYSNYYSQENMSNDFTQLVNLEHLRYPIRIRNLPEFIFYLPHIKKIEIVDWFMKENRYMTITIFESHEKFNEIIIFDFFLNKYPSLVNHFKDFTFIKTQF